MTEQAKPHFTAVDKMREAQREVEMRQAVYTRQQHGSPLTKKQIARIEIMQEIERDYAAVAEKERLL